MMSFAILIWIASGENPIDSSLLAEVYGIPPSPHDKRSLHIDISSFSIIKFLLSRNKVFCFREIKFFLLSCLCFFCIINMFLFSDNSLACVGICRYFCCNNPNHGRRNMLLW